MVLNLFRAVANFFRVSWPTLRGLHIFVAHFDYVGDVMMSKFLGSASELMAAEAISKIKGHCLPSAEDGQSANGIGADLQRKIRSMLLQFMVAGPYGCSYAPVFLNLIRLANPLLRYANVCGPLDLRAVAHRLRTRVLHQCQ